MQAGFHNHDGEFKQIDGILIYDKLMSELDPQLVKMQYQVAVGRLGFDAADAIPEVFRPIHIAPPPGLVPGGQENDANRQRVSRLEKAFRLGEESRREELLRGSRTGFDEGELHVPSRTEGLGQSN